MGVLMSAALATVIVTGLPSLSTRTQESFLPLMDLMQQTQPWSSGMSGISGASEDWPERTLLAASMESTRNVGAAPETSSRWNLAISAGEAIARPPALLMIAAPMAAMTARLAARARAGRCQDRLFRKVSGGGTSRCIARSSREVSTGRPRSRARRPATARSRSLPGSGSRSFMGSRPSMGRTSLDQSSLARQGQERLADHQPSAMRTRLDRPDRHLQHLGRLLLIETFHVHQEERPADLLRQPSQDIDHLLVREGVEDLLRVLPDTVLSLRVGTVGGLE